MNDDKQDKRKANIKLRSVNTSKIYMTGSIWESKSYGKFTIIGQSENYRLKDNYKYYDKFLIEFETGYQKEAKDVDIKLGRLKDLYRPSVYGVGYMGVGSYVSSINGVRTPQYELWTGVLYRCYSEEYHKEKPTYKDCSVDPRWHNFQNFCHDIQKLEGYAEWIGIGTVKYQLDKDIKFKGNKIYSKDACMFVTASDNNSYAHISKTSLFAIRISDNYKEEFYNQSAFSRKYGLNTSCISACLLGNRKRHKGWKFCKLI